MSARLYKYVGSPEILKSVAGADAGAPINNADDLRRWLSDNREESEATGEIFATYTVDRDGRLLLAPRRTEHVACASGGPVRAAGEMAFNRDTQLLYVSNQSTGFCPEPESWPEVAASLKNVVPDLPSEFSRAFTFRRCPNCSQILVIKDDWYVCDVCDADVPRHWNFED